MSQSCWSGGEGPGCHFLSQEEVSVTVLPSFLVTRIASDGHHGGEL